MADQASFPDGLMLPEPGRCWSQALPHEADSVPLARALVRRVLHDIGDPVDSFAAALATTELVANALEHTPRSGPVRLVLGWDGTAFQIEVGDGLPPDADLDPRLHQGFSVSDCGEPAEGGRGMLIIHMLTDRVGVRVTPTGKAVWCLLRSA